VSTHELRVRARIEELAAHVAQIRGEIREETSDYRIRRLKDEEEYMTRTLAINHQFLTLLTGGSVELSK
jgi:hypothetical protein